MASEAAHPLADYLHQLSSAARFEKLPDRVLIERFAAERDEDAFAALVRRHGPMVLRVCQRILHNTHAAEDAFQATFLVFSRKAASLCWDESVGCWLHAVAFRLAQNARKQRARRQKHEVQAAIEKHADDPLAELSVREAQAILDEELARLPEKYRAPLLLCCLEGRSREEAAQQLGWSAKLVKSRLEQGRERLRHRLIRRGLTLPAALMAALLTEEAAPAAVSVLLVRATVGAVKNGDGISASVALLAESALGGTAAVKTKVILAGVLLLAGALAAGVGALAPPKPAEKQTETPATAKAQESPKSEKPQEKRTDLYGDPLPSGAIARLGTIRWRQGDQVTAVAFAPDGKTLASASWDGGIHLWDSKTGKLLKILRGYEAFVSSIFFTPDGKRLISCGGDAHTPHSARVWDVATAKELRRWLAPGGWKSALSPDGKQLLAGSDHRANRGIIPLWDVATGKLVRELPFEGAQAQDGVIDLAFSPNGKQLISSGGSILRLFDVEKGKQLRTFGEGKRITSVALSPDGKTVAVGRYQEPAALWDIATFTRIRQFGDGKGSARVAFSHDGKTLAECRFGFGNVILWDVATGKKLRQLQGTVFQVWDLAFSPNDKILAVGNFDSQVRLWDVSTSKEIASIGDYRNGVEVLAFVDRGKGIASVSNHGMICQWDIAASKVVRKFQEEGTHCYCGDLSPDGRMLAIGEQQGVHLFDWSSGKKMRLLKGHKYQVWSAVFAPKGDILASSANLDNQIRLWDVAAGKELRRITTPYIHGLRTLAWASHGKMLASAGVTVEASRATGMVYLWDPSTCKQLRAWPIRLSADRWQRGDVYALAFSPDGTHLAAPDGDNTIVIWDVASGRMFARLPGPQKSIRALAFSPDGRMLASGSDDRTILLWELSSWKERRRYESHLGSISKLVFSADGLTLASASGDTSVLLWAVMDRDPRRQQAEPTLAPRQLEKLWADLASEDASRAWRALRALVGSPKQMIPCLKEHLKPLTAANLARIEHLIKELDSDQFSVRQQAAQELEKLGGQAEPALRNALEKKPSLEVRRRVEQLLEKLEEPVRNAETMRQLRSLEALEHIGTAEARALLRSLSAGAPDARLTREAKASLERTRHKASTAP